MKQTHEDMLTQFEAYLLTERRVARNTFAAYRRDITQLITFFERKEIPLEGVSITHLKQFIAYLYGQRMSARSIARKISSVRAFFSYRSMQLGVANVAHALHIPKLEHTLPRYLTEKEVKRLLDCASKGNGKNGPRDRIMLYLLYASGMRISELIALRCSNVRSEGTLIAVAGKGGRERLIPIPPSMAHMIMDYITNNKAVRARKNKEGYLFPIQYNRVIQPISRQSCWTIVRSLCKKAGIKRSVSPHQLRHSFATHMLKSGADLRSLQMLLGHENLTTVQVYTHVETSHLRSIYDKKHPRS